MTEEIDWLVGVDWASAEHQVCILDAAGEVLGERASQHSGAGQDRLCAWLLQTTRAPAGRIGVAIEVPHGPVVETRLERGFAVHAINPKQLNRFRDRFTMAGSKDDRVDARVLADALRTDRHRLRRLHQAAAEIVALREVSRLVEDLRQERTRLTNRMREQPWRYYPQILHLTDDVGEPWILALWSHAPTPAKARRLRMTTITRLLKANRIRRVDAGTVIAILRQPAIDVAPGTTEAACRHIQSLVARLKVVNRQLKDATAELTRRTEALSGEGDAGPERPVEQRDATILRSLPGVGPIVLATLLAEGSDALRRRDYRDYHALRSLCGIAPVTKRSGKRLVVVMRQACQMRLRNAAYHWARVAAQPPAVPSPARSGAFACSRLAQRRRPPLGCRRCHAHQRVSVRPQPPGAPPTHLSPDTVGALRRRPAKPDEPTARTGQGRSRAAARLRVRLDEEYSRLTQHSP